MRVSLIALCAALLFTACQENQKETVRELESREAKTAAAIAKETRRNFESDVESKLQGIKSKIDEGRMQVAMAGPNANRLVVAETTRQLDQLDQELLAVRNDFDQMKTDTDEQFVSRKEEFRTRVNRLREDYMRLATGSRR